MNKTILSVEHPFLKNLGKKTFSMIILGMETLNVRSDISLQIIIRDLFDQYMPLLIIPTINTNTFKVSDSLLKCFKDAKIDFICLILEILMTNFFTISNDNMMHKHSYLVYINIIIILYVIIIIFITIKHISLMQVMIILQNLLKGEKNYAYYIVEHIILICTSYIIKCYIKVHDHHPHKQQTIDFISSIINNIYYKEDNTLR